MKKEKFIERLKFGLEVIMCLVKYIWLVVRVPLSLPIAAIIVFCFIITIPLWFLMACVDAASADEVIRDFCNWYASPVVEYWHWCMKIADPYTWSRPARRVLASFPRD